MSGEGKTREEPRVDQVVLSLQRATASVFPLGIHPSGFAKALSSRIGSGFGGHGHVSGTSGRVISGRFYRTHQITSQYWGDATCLVDATSCPLEVQAEPPSQAKARDRSTPKGGNHYDYRD